MTNFQIPFFVQQILGSIILYLVFFSLKKIFNKSIGRFGRANSLAATRILRAKRFVIFFTSTVALSLLFLIWGVRLKEFFLIAATTFTIIGTACFASWSNLSNISSGVILFFSYDLKLGDKIKVNGTGEEIKRYH